MSERWKCEKWEVRKSLTQFWQLSPSWSLAINCCNMVDGDGDGVGDGDGDGDCDGDDGG